MKFPIHKILDEVRSTLSNHPQVWIQSPTGSGKSTHLPLELCKWEELEQKIYVVVPRRIAAIHAANYVSGLMGEKVGQKGAKVGYQVKGENKSGSKLNYITDGLFLRILQSDPELLGTSLVILDEIHERRLQQDLLYYLLGQCQEFYNSDLKLMYLSATLEGLAIPEGHPKLSSEGRIFDVEISYLPQRPSPKWMFEFIDFVNQTLQTHEGDALVFLPGSGEVNFCIEKLKDAMGSVFSESIEFCPLYGSLSFDVQKRALVSSEKRKVIVATNIAESSLTIEGVQLVIDSGWMKSIEYKPNYKRDVLVETKISKASATQRAGRAGRTQAGKCFRFWPANENKFLKELQKAEVHRSNLSAFYLELLLWGDPGADQGTWLEQPKGLEQAINELELLGMIDEQGNLKKEGEYCLNKGMSPRLAKLYYEASERGIEVLGKCLSAWLNELGRDVKHYTLDLEANLQNLLSSRSKLPKGLQCFSELKDFDSRDLSVLIAKTYPEWIAKKRPSGGYVLAGGGELILEESKFSKSEFLAVASFRGKSRAELVVSIDKETLIEEFGVKLETHIKVEKDNLGFVQKEICAGLVLSERPTAPPKLEELKSCVIEYLKSQSILELWNSEEGYETYYSRVSWFLSQNKGLEISLEDWQSEAYFESKLEQWFFTFWKGQYKPKDLKSMPWKDMLNSLLGWELSMKIDSACPSQIKIPSGRQKSLRYDLEKGPVLKVKLQEMFGCKSLQIVGEGEAPRNVVIEMMSPGKVMLAEVRDLEHFWNNVYPQVRKEIRNSYKRHPWPKDPWTAEPTHLTQRAFKRVEELKAGHP